ncbi:MAG: hypothetical protein IT457_19835 [Planctomycetes bacterium]|nr:hypothetical protein [Planctomycetota bacterium]
MSWQRDRADENYRAGEIALASGLPNAAASRLYYSLYHLAWHGLSAQGKSPAELQSQNHERWEHAFLTNNTRLVAMSLKLGQPRSRSFKELFTTLCEQRVRADYQATGAQTEVLEESLPRLRELLDQTKDLN